MSLDSELGGVGWERMIFQNIGRQEGFYPGCHPLALLQVGPGDLQTPAVQQLQQKEGSLDPVGSPKSPGLNRMVGLPPYPSLNQSGFPERCATALIG